jgi:hypothetical protein
MKDSFLKPGTYEIKVDGVLHDQIFDRISKLKISVEPLEKEGYKTTITGKFSDQAALSGLLSYIYNLHLTVLSVRKIEVNNDLA